MNHNELREDKVQELIDYCFARGMTVNKEVYNHFQYLFPSQDTSKSDTIEEVIERIPKEVVGRNRNVVEVKDIEHLLRIGWGGGDWFAYYEFYDSIIENEYGLPLEGRGSTLLEALTNLERELKAKDIKR